MEKNQEVIGGIAAHLDNPLVLVGFGLLLVVVLYRTLLKKGPLGPSTATGRILKRLSKHVLVLALLAVIAGFGLAFYQSNLEASKPSRSVVTASVEAAVAAVEAAHASETGRGRADPERQRAEHERLIEAVTRIDEGAATDKRYADALDLLKAGNVAEAEPLLRAVAEDRTAGAHTDPRAAAEAWRTLGAIAATVDPKRAREAYTEAARLDPDNVDGTYWHGVFELEAGNLNEAETAYWSVVAIGVPGTDDRALFWSHLGLGDIARARGDLADAKTDYVAARDIARPLAAAEPGNADWQRDLSVSYRKLGDVQVAQGDLDAALKSYRDGLDIARRLAASDPGNAGWQRDLSVSYGMVGNVQLQQGSLDAALDSFRRTLDIQKRLAASAPDSAGWQRDLSVSYEKVGNVQVAQGDLAGALKSYRDGLDIRRLLAASAPGNALWQRDLIVSNVKLAELATKAGTDGAAEYYAEALGVAERLAAAGRLAPRDAWMIDDLRRRLAAAQTQTAPPAAGK